MEFLQSLGVVETHDLPQIAGRFFMSAKAMTMPSGMSHKLPNIIPFYPGDFSMLKREFSMRLGYVWGTKAEGSSENAGTGSR